MAVDGLDLPVGRGETYGSLKQPSTNRRLTAA
jgi:hypothetical protein